MRLAGYTDRSVATYAPELMRKTEIRKALEKKGLSDNFLLGKMKKMIKIGSANENISADTATRNIELAFRLSGALDTEKIDTNTTNNIYIKELRMLDNTQLMNKLAEISTEAEVLSPTPTTNPTDTTTTKE
jgi:hypothetical protein